MKSDLKAPQKVKLIIAILITEKKLLETCKELLEKEFGRIDFISEFYSFYETKFYDVEMGKNLLRFFISFENLISPEEISKIKLLTNEFEESFRNIPRQRTINFDPGYIDYNKVVLASTKFQGQKIFLSQGIYADLVLYYRKGNYIPFEWTFPDFKTDRYYKTFLKIRNLFKEQLKSDALLM